MNNLSEANNVNVTIDKKEQEKIWWYVNKCPKEISGLGKVVVKDDGTLHVRKIYLLNQEVSGSETELDDDAVATLLYESHQDEGSLMFWWHSHVNMGVFWSGTDHEAIRKLGANGMVLSTVYNKKGEHRTSLYMAADSWRPSVFVDNLSLRIAPELSQDETATLESEYGSKVKEAKLNTFPSYAGTYNGAKPKITPKV